MAVLLFQLDLRALMVRSQDVDGASECRNTLAGISGVSSGVDYSHVSHEIALRARR